LKGIVQIELEGLGSFEILAARQGRSQATWE